MRWTVFIKVLINFKNSIESIIDITFRGIPMKILRYLIFISILSGIFFVIYRQSDEKSFRRW